MTAQSEPEIIRKAITGDTHAFRQLVKQYQAFAFSLAYRFLNNSSDAQDITQEAFIRLWKNLPRYRAEIRLSTWLYKIVTNLCLDQLRSVYRKQSRNTHDVDHDFTVADPLTADQPLLHEELRTIILKMAEALTPKQKAVFILRDLEELPVPEVCEILSMTTGNVKSNLYYARIRMSTLIDQYYREQKTKPV